MKQFRVLMQNRGNAFTHRGGDTVVMEKLKEGLTKRGVHVTIDIEGTEDPAGYDIVHLINFALPDLLRHFAENAHKKGVPFVVTTLLEDVENFHNQSIVCANLLMDYVRNGQNKTWLDDKWGTIHSIHKSPRFVNDWVVKHAACLFSNGAGETRTIRQQYGESTRIREVKLGYEIGTDGDAQEFIRTYGVRDFVLCVGRLETRKNQLMLLKALEDEDIPVVFAAGGFTYQPDYADAVRNFKRKGQTLVLDKLSPEMLAGAYKAARVHALASWYELPGLVSLEAGYFGARIVATNTGTSADYLGDKAFYCQPDNAESIRNAVLAAYYGSGKEKTKEWVSQYTWDATAEATLKAYEEITGTKATQTVSMPTSAPMYDMSSSVTEFQELLERGEIAARNREFEVATRCFDKAETLNPSSTRLLRAKGAVLLAQSDHVAAQRYFERTIAIDSKDPKAWSGLGMCEMMNKRIEIAYHHFVNSLDLAPNQLVPILQLMECSYALGRFEDLEKTLRKFVSENPNDIQMRFCLAGCLYKLGRWDEARHWNEGVLKEDGTHNGANELKSLLAKEGTQSAPLRSSIEMESTAAATYTSADQIIGEIEEDKRRREYESARGKLAKLLTRTDLSSAQRERARIIDAELIVVSGNWDDAERRFDEILADNNSNSRARCGKGAIWVARGDWEKAKAMFEEAIKIDSKSDIAYAGLGLWEQHKGSKEAAWDYYSKAVTVNPENSRALLGLIELGYSLKRYESLQQVIEQYLEMHPADLDFLYALAGCLYIQDKLDDAKRELDKIALFEPAHVKANELRGLIESRSAETRA